MKKSVLDSMINNALPYFIGGALLFWAWRRYLFSFDEVKYVEEKSLKTSINWAVMTEDERDRYALSQADLIGDILGFRVFSSWRTNDDVVAIVKNNSFCIERIGKMFDRPFWSNPFRQRLSSFLTISLSSEDLIQITDELQLLRDVGY